MKKSVVYKCFVQLANWHKTRKKVIFVFQYQTNKSRNKLRKLQYKLQMAIFSCLTCSFLIPPTSSICRSLCRNTHAFVLLFGDLCYLSLLLSIGLHRRISVKKNLIIIWSNLRLQVESQCELTNPAAWNNKTSTKFYLVLSTRLLVHLQIVIIINASAYTKNY